MKLRAKRLRSYQVQLGYKSDSFFGKRGNH
ncbi:hypothetical protein [Acinetobacter phage Ab69]|nr:hypothetical protein [Acinetobacter phage Ab69]